MARDSEIIKREMFEKWFEKKQVKMTGINLHQQVRHNIYPLNIEDSAVLPSEFYDEVDFYESVDKDILFEFADKYWEEEFSESFFEEAEYDMDFIYSECTSFFNYVLKMWSKSRQEEIDKEMEEHYA